MTRGAATTTTSRSTGRRSSSRREAGNDDERQEQVAAQRARARQDVRERARMRGMFLAEVSTDDIKPDPNRSWWNRGATACSRRHGHGRPDQDRQRRRASCGSRRCRPAPRSPARRSPCTRRRQAGVVDVTNSDGLIKIPVARCSSSRSRSTTRTRSTRTGQLPQPAADRDRREGRRPRGRRRQLGERDPESGTSVSRGPPRRCDQDPRVHPERPRAVPARRVGSLQGHRT